MRTKTLLVAAAALLAVGVATSQAQVYSQNVVGYVNINLTNGVLACISPALDLDGTGTNNTITTVCGTNLPLQTTVYVFNNSGGFDQLVYKSSHGVTGWYFGAGLDNNYSMNPGVGIFIQTTANATVTQVGNVLQGSLTNQYFPSTGGSIWLLSSQVPVGGGITTTLGYVPTLQDQVYVYDPIALNYAEYVYKSQHAVTGWYLGASVSEPQIQVGQGFWLIPANSGEVWTNNFIVQ